MIGTSSKGEAIFLEAQVAYRKMKKPQRDNMFSQLKYNQGQEEPPHPVSLDLEEILFLESRDHLCLHYNIGNGIRQGYQ